jgi:hypothetical protein
MPKSLLHRVKPIEYQSATGRGQGGAWMRTGSLNALVDGSDRVRAFKGPLLLGGGKLGSRIFFNAHQKYAGLGTHAVNGTGAAFAVRKLLMAIGAGQVRFDGADLAAFVASSTLSYVKESGAGYAATVYQAGRAQPSAPLIFAKDNPSAGHTGMTGAVAVGIHRSSTVDGQVSNVSLPSNVLTLSNQSVIVQVPAADTNGQTHWGIDVPKIGFADLGFLIQLPTSLGGERAESSLATIDLVTRAVEVSWTNGALLDQPLAPTKAYPPVAGQFAGNINDVLFLDADGIIYVGEPGYIGSFAPSNALFTSEAAVHYLRIGKRAYARLGHHSVGVLTYVGGSPALEYDEILTGIGIALPQNVALGFGGRLLMWLGAPTALDDSLEPDFEYASKVLPDFAGWDAGQSAAKPIVPGFDPAGLYEVWCYGKTVMAKHAPSGRWCSPQDLTGRVIGDVVACVVYERKLYLACMSGSTISLYQYDAGTGTTVMTIVIDDTAPSPGATISEHLAKVQTDDGAHNVKLVLRKNYDQDTTVYEALAPAVNKPVHIRSTAQVLNCEAHSYYLELPCAGGDAFVELFESYGTPHMTRIS